MIQWRVARYGLIAGASIVGIMAIILGWYVFRQAVENRRLSDAGEAATLFLQEIADGQLESAYDRTTSAFREKYSFKVFSNVVEAHPALMVCATLSDQRRPTPMSLHSA